MDDSKLSFVAHLVHLPLHEAFIVTCEASLDHRVAIWHFKYLTEQELVLLGQLEGVVLDNGFFLQDFLRVFGQVDFVQSLLSNLNLIHVYHLS